MPTDPTDPHAVAATAARALLEAIADVGPSLSVRVTDELAGVACQILVWEASVAMPTVSRARRERAACEREGCRAAIVAAIEAAGRPLTRRAVVRALKDAGGGHGEGTVAKALAELTRDGLLDNPRDRKGYRLAAWRERRPRLF